MSYTDDAVLAKLSALSETQDSIVTVAQWIMFHRRHADRTVQLWLQRLKESTSSKRLNLIYLANEVCQQSKARRKDDFLLAFSPSIAEAVATAYKGAPTDVQTRIRRVVDVWRERNVFAEPVQSAVEGRIQELDKARGAVKSSSGGSIFGSASLPAELSPLAGPQQNVTKLIMPTKATIDSAKQEYEKLMGPAASVPSAPVFAARLSGLLKTIAQAESTVEQSVKARRELEIQLQKLIESNRMALLSEEAMLDQFTENRAQVEEKKTEVERAIMAGLPSDEPNLGNGPHDNVEGGFDRPEVEALTPPTLEPEFPEQAASEDLESTETAIQQSAALTDLEALPGIASHHKAVPTAVNGSKKRRLDEDQDPFGAD